jgi:hypothetical protein
MWHLNCSISPIAQETGGSRDANSLRDSSAWGLRRLGDASRKNLVTPLRDHNATVPIGGSHGSLGNYHDRVHNVWNAGAGYRKRDD